MLKASDIMTKNPFTVAPGVSVRELANTLAQKNFNGAPVVDEKGKLLGVVTLSDVIYQKKKLHMPAVFTLFDSIIPLGGLHEVDAQMDKILGRTVGEIMSTDLITVSEDASLEEIATIMTEDHKHLIPVLKEGALTGVVDRWDVLRAIAREE